MLLVIGQDLLVGIMRCVGDEFAFFRFFERVEIGGADVYLLGKLHHIGARFFENGFGACFDGLRANDGADAYGNHGERTILSAHKIGKDECERNGKADGIGLAAACCGEQDEKLVEIGCLRALRQRPCVGVCPKTDGDEQHKQGVERERDIEIRVFHKAA